MTVALEKHQDSSLRKINELNDDYTNQKEKHDKIVTELEGKEKKLNEDVEKLTFVSVLVLFKCWWKVVLFKIYSFKKKIVF